ncbi:MAG: hypothetical protein HZB16_04875 [Armatimonadetes bacterium]|nr:hypothetical protein [Armatimonadota bacterium]
MDAPPSESCPECGAGLSAGAARCAHCGWAARPPDRGRAWRLVAAFFLLLPALALGALGGTCTVIGMQDRSDHASMNIGLIMLAVSGLIVSGAVMLARRRR